MKAHQLLLSVAAVLLIAACGPRPQDAPAPTLPPAEAASITATPATPSTHAAPLDVGRDLEAVNLCALISNAEAAESMAAQPARDDLEGVTGPNCVYQITPDGGSTIQNVYVYLYALDLAEVSLALLRDAGATQLDGLGSDALVAYEADSEQYRLVGLRSGDFGFEILAPSEQGAQRLARLILERLPAEG